MVELSNFSDSTNMSYTLVNGIKIVYLYGIAGPEEPNLYDIIREYAFENNLASEDSVGRHLNFTLLRKFFRRIEEVTGFKHLDFDGAWDPDTKESAVILVFARERAPTDEGEIEKIKRAVEVVRRVLGLEGTEKWYIEDNDDLDDGTVPDNLEPPPRFT